MKRLTGRSQRSPARITSRIDKHRDFVRNR